MIALPLTVDQYSLGLFIPDLQDHLVGLALCCQLRERGVRFGLLRFPFLFRGLWMIGRMIDNNMFTRTFVQHKQLIERSVRLA